MKDISDKVETLRTAKAQCVLIARPETVNKIRFAQLEKGDALSLAKAAAVLAVKRVWELIPYCHPVKVDFADVDFTFTEETITITVSVKAIDKTGVEMEALTGVAIAALTIYDMAKPEDPKIVISDLKLLEKTGGKTDFIDEMKQPIQSVVIVLSDTVFAGKKEDKAGKNVIEVLKKYNITLKDYTILPDEPEKLKAKIDKCIEEKVDLILTVGGTGLGARDKTVETVKPLLDTEIPGIMEAARNYGQKRTPYSMLSRGVAGLVKNTLIITLPGSSRGALESVNALFPGVLHIFSVLRKDPHRYGYN